MPGLLNPPPIFTSPARLAAPVTDAVPPTIMLESALIAPAEHSIHAIFTAWIANFKNQSNGINIGLGG